MIIGTIKESNESRIAIVPQVAKKLGNIDNVQVVMQSSITELFDEQSYNDAGVQFLSREEVLKTVDILLLFHPLPVDEIKLLKKGTMIISHMDPYNNKSYVDELVNANVNSFSMEMIPRSTIAQKMDSLSSQASLAGYVSVIQGASLMEKIFPMMMTPSGTIAPAKVFVIGVGVAGLQAIATAKRLGAKVEAFDTRPTVEEQVQSLGAKFVKVDLGEMSQTKDGYANELTKEQLQMQQAAMEKSCINADLVITTAKLFGRKAPVIVTDAIVSKMKKGSVIVDLAASTGGNVEGTVLNQITNVHGVQIVGTDNLEKQVPLDASTMYANNLYNLLTHLHDKYNNKFDFSSDEIAQSAVITFEGKVVNERINEFYTKGGIK